MGSLSERGTIHPSRPTVIFWGVATGAVAAVMLLVGGEDALSGLQTITEQLGTQCKGRAWVIVTSQEDIDAAIGEATAAAMEKLGAEIRKEIGRAHV